MIQVIITTVPYFKHKTLHHTLHKNITINHHIVLEDTCYPNPCQNDGYCVIDQENGYECYCTHGYHGDNCQIGNGIVTFIGCHEFDFVKKIR